jgi:hypothetical protein
MITILVIEIKSEEHIYLQKRLYQPIDHDFSKTQYEKTCHHFFLFNRIHRIC